MLLNKPPPNHSTVTELLNGIIGKKCSQSYAIPWGSTFVVWKLFAFFVHVLGMLLGYIKIHGSRLPAPLTPKSSSKFAILLVENIWSRWSVKTVRWEIKRLIKKKKKKRWERFEIYRKELTGKKQVFWWKK